jgi:peptidyl-prolyl cis-trans isomerase C
MSAVLPLAAAETAPAQPPPPPAVAAPADKDNSAELNASLAFIPEVAAKYGAGKTISGAELKKLLLPALKMASEQGQAPAAEEIRSAAAQALNMLVEMDLLKEQCVKDGIKADPAAAEKKLLEQAGGEENLNMILATNGGDKKDLVEKVATSMMIQQWVEAKIKPGIKVDDAAVQKFYDDNKERFQMPEQMSASHILVKVEEGAGEEAKKAAKAKAEQILAELKKGADFAKLAAEKSDCPSGKQNGGSLGSFSKGQMIPEFEEAAAKLKKDELSGIVETEYGFHIIKGGENKPAGLVPLEQVKERIAASLVNQELDKTMEKTVAELRKAANVQILLPGEKKVEAEKPAAPAPKK